MQFRARPDQVTDALVLGGGTIGSSWTAYFVARGLRVQVVEPRAATTAVAAHVERHLAVLRPQTGPADSARGRFRVHRHLNAVTAQAQFVQECIVEDLEAKRQALRDLERNVAADVVICTSTSALLPSAIQAGCRHPQRFLAGHPFNPPHLLPLVEVVSARHTHPAAAEWAMAFYAAVGKRPVRVRKEVRGHIANRLTSALFREAVHLVTAGIATAQDVDAAIATGPGLRWALMGPFLIYHLGGGAQGIEGYLEHLGDTHPARWAELGTPAFGAEERQAIIASVQEAYGDTPIEEWRAARDQGLAALLRQAPR